ncbi:MAG: hypothetical protein WCE30_07885 [Mycobacterium sp.]
MQPNVPPLDDLLNQLRAAHTAGLHALNVGALISTQRAAARQLSEALQTAANSALLWDSLAPSETVHNLTAAQRNNLRRMLAEVAVGFPWQPLLNDIGYQPPPTTAEWENYFSEAVNNPGDGDFNRDALRGRFLEFAGQLSALSEDPNSTQKKLRRAIWGGVKMVGGAIVGCTISAVAAPFVAPAAPVLIAAAPFLGAIGGAAITDFIVDVGKESVGKLVDKVRNRGKAQDRGIPDKAAFVALSLAESISEPVLRGLRRAWIRRESADDRTIATQAFSSVIRRRISWINANVGGEPWFIGSANPGYCTEILGLVDRLDECLAESQPCRAEVVTILGMLAQRVPMLKTAMHQVVSPRDTTTVDAEAATRRHQSIADLDSDITTAEQQETAARNKLRLAERDPNPGHTPATVYQQIVTECTAVTEALRQLRTTVAMS